MLHRITVMLIIGFWAAMTGLLVVREVYPESTKLNDIPVTHVGRGLEGRLHVKDLVYFVTVIGASLVLTHRVVESHRWR